MVCLPCIVIPFFLFIWHKFLQPIFLRFWNPWARVEEGAAVDANNDPVTGAAGDKETESLDKAKPGPSSASPVEVNTAKTATTAAHTKID